jgi:hypothetical protein
VDARIQIVAILGAAVLLFVVLELVRRRRLLERYALLWLLSSVILLGLAIWRGVLEQIADGIGVAYPPNALFLIAFLFILLLLLHFSVVVSRLADQTKVLAQRLAQLEARVGNDRTAREEKPLADESVEQPAEADSLTRV